MPLQTAILKKKTILNNNVCEFHFEIKSPLKFKSGQYITIKIDDNIEPPCFRAYSLASPPNKYKTGFDLCIKFIEGGRASKWFKNMKTGTKIEFLSAQGHLIFNEQSNKDAVFVATGTGVAPFKAIIEEQLTKGNKQKMKLYFGIRYIKDIFYQEFFEKLAQKHKNFKFQIILSRPEDKSWKGPKGHVTDLIKTAEISPKTTEVYICGLENMINDAKKVLQQKGFSETEFHIEKY